MKEQKERIASRVLATVIALCMVLPAGAMLSGRASAETTTSSEEGITESGAENSMTGPQSDGALPLNPLEVSLPVMLDLEPPEIEPPQPSAPEEPPVLPEPKMGD